MKLPPIEYFYGRTPLRVWISKCKPFIPIKKPTVMNINFYVFPDAELKKIGDYMEAQRREYDSVISSIMSREQAIIKKHR